MKDRVPQDFPERSWRRVYVGVVVTTCLVVAGLWAFSIYFSR